MSAPADVHGKPIIWTNSTLQTLQSCGEKFRLKYIQRVYAPTRPRLVRGTAVHQAARSMMLQKMRLGELPTPEEVKDVAATEFESAWEKDDVALEPEESVLGAASAHGYQKDLAIDLAGLYRRVPAPHILPVGVEHRIEVRPRDMDITIAGTLDLIDGQPTGEIVRDVKTSEKSPSKDMADHSEQLSMYALIRSAEAGHLPDRLALDYLVRTPARRELKHVPLDTTRDGEDMRVLVARLNAAIDAVAAGRFVPVSSEHWSCSQTWCEFYGGCRYVRRGDRRPLS